MWRKEDGSPQASSEVSSSPMNSTTTGKTGASGASAFAPPTISPKAAACISQGIKIKGEVTGTEDLFVDGNIEGKISLVSSVLTIGPNALATAEIAARELIVRGRVTGKLTASDRVQVWHTARIEGDIKADRIAIEEGAELHGKIETGKATGNVAAGSPGHSKKSEGSKVPAASGGEDRTASGTAMAGAD